MQMPTEPTSEKKQSLAFGYLRERAYRHHLEGDGLRVNSLCSIAIARIESLANENKLLIRLNEVRWCFIFPLYWLIDSYMLNAVERGLKSFQKSGKSDEWLHSIIHEYHFLISQPLASYSDSFKVLQTASLSELGEDHQCEDLILLTHIVELVWFRTVRDAGWEKLVDHWLTKSPTWAKRILLDLKNRLQIQTRLAAPNLHSPPVTVDIVKSLPKEFRLADLWVQILFNEGKAIDQSIERLNSVTEPDSHIARLLFDVHHSNRFFGQFGEAQEVGLSRRRLLISTSPLLIFNELREARRSEQLAELIKSSEIGFASGRFHMFTLAMLCELSALRLWDFSAWRDAIEAQGEAYLETCRWKEADAAMAAFGIFLTVQGLGYQPMKQNSLVRNAISRLEFAPESVLSELANWLLMPYPRQKPFAYKCFADLSDLLPEEHWFRWAEWTISYMEECRQGKHMGGSVNPLSPWTAILKYADSESKVWELFFPEVSRLARNPVVWQVDNDIFDIWLTKAPIELAKKIGLEMLAIPVVDSSWRKRRADILYRAEIDRSELSNAFSQQLIKLAVEPLEILSLGGGKTAEIQTAAKAQYKQTLEKYIDASVPPPKKKEYAFSIVPNGPISMLSWDIGDKPLIESLVSAIGNKSVMSNSLCCLIWCLESLIRVGPVEFAEYVLPKYEEWVKNPPVDIDPMKHLTGPFSAVQFNNKTKPEIYHALGQMAFQLRYKLGTTVDPLILSWLQKSLIAPEPAAIPIMIYVALPAASSVNDAARTDLLTTCQTLLLHLWSRHQVEEQAGIHLANAILYIGMLLQREDHPSGKWNTDEGKEAVNMLMEKYSPMFVAFSESTHPDVRASIASLLKKLNTWKPLSTEMHAVLDGLCKDNRARVRCRAQGREV
jgi:hypothetical protein